jgi:hypothetical protein
MWHIERFKRDRWTLTNFSGVRLHEGLRGVPLYILVFRLLGQLGASPRHAEAVRPHLGSDPNLSHRDTRVQPITTNQLGRRGSQGQCDGGAKPYLFLTVGSRPLYFMPFI